MKKKFMLIICFSLIATMYGKEKVKKHRDQLRLRYDYIEVIISTDDNGNSRKDIYCSSGGDMRCRDQNVIFSGGGTELDFDNPQEYTLAERGVAQGTINLGDDDMDNGSTFGTRTNTTQFTDVVTNLSYYRTFTYSWVTNGLGEVTAVLNISDKF